MTIIPSIISIIVETKREVEVDPEKLDTPSGDVTTLLQTNAQNLIAVTRKVLYLLIDSAADMAPNSLVLYQHIYRAYLRSRGGEGDSNSAALSMLSSFVILRLFSPLILNPLLLGLEDRYSRENRRVAVLGW